MEWQTAVTVAVAGACAAWVLWSALRPFTTRLVSACGLCPGCGPVKEDGAGQPKGDLLQIEPTD